MAHASVKELVPSFHPRTLVHADSMIVTYSKVCHRQQCIGLCFTLWQSPHGRLLNMWLTNSSHQCTQIPKYKAGIRSNQGPLSGAYQLDLRTCISTHTRCIRREQSVPHIFSPSCRISQIMQEQRRKGWSIDHCIACAVEGTSSMQHEDRGWAVVRAV